VGLLLSILTTAALLPALVWGLVWGIPFGVVFAAVGYGLTGGRRDFTSVSITVPSRFEVVAAAAYGELARAALASGRSRRLRRPRPLSARGRAQGPVAR
jgi:hypothetical protein